MHRHEPGGRLGAARQCADLRGRLAQFRLDAIKGAEISEEGRRPVVAGGEGLDKRAAAMGRMESFPYEPLCCGVNMRENLAIPL
jgi:hypothetical protein